jgi:acyl-coenzyme A thioesterase 13
VTRSLSISYLRIVPINAVVQINSKVVQVGRTMALIQSEMVSQDGKITYCTAENHKVSVPTPKHHLSPKYEVEWDRVMKAEGKKESGLWTPKMEKGRL